MHRKDLVKPDGRRLILYSERPIADNIVATNPPHEPFTSSSHFRWHPLRGEWVAYASHRQERTFLPPKEYSPLAVTKSPEFPTEMPAGDYEVAVFENLFPSLSESASASSDPRIETAPAKGVCEVVVFTQDADASLANLPVERIALVLKVFADRTRELEARGGIEYALPFENRGVEVGVTLHHPHGQIYAYPFVPPVPAQMTKMQSAYLREHHQGLMEAMLKEEVADGRRIITRNENAISFIPVCARYPYETWIVPTRRVSYLYELSERELLDYARALKMTLMKYDAMWAKPFPYLMVLYQAPMDRQPHPEWHTHFEIYPPYRTRDRLKFLAGTEIGAGLFVNDSQPEAKAAELRAVEVSID